MINLSTMHALLMIAAWGILLAAFVVVRFMKGKRLWFKSHRTLAVVGCSFVVIALIAVVLDIFMTKREHLAIPHAYVGYAAFVFAILTPALAYLQFKVPSAAARIRIVHRWAGRITLAIMAINIFLGLSYVGLI